MDPSQQPQPPYGQQQYPGQPYPQQYPQQQHGGYQQGYGQQGYGHHQGYYQQGYYQQQGYQYPGQEMLPPGTQAADKGRRFAAAVIDGLALGALTMVILVVIGVLPLIMATASAESTGEPNGVLITLAIVGMVIGYAQVFFLPFIYKAMAEANRGATIGKRAMKMRVIDLQTLGNPRKGKSFLRALVYFLLGWISCLWILFDPRQQALHDKAGDTAVIDA